MTPYYKEFQKMFKELQKEGLLDSVNWRKPRSFKSPHFYFMYGKEWNVTGFYKGKRSDADSISIGYIKYYQRPGGEVIRNAFEMVVNLNIIHIKRDSNFRNQLPRIKEYLRAALSDSWWKKLWYNIRYLNIVSKELNIL